MRQALDSSTLRAFALCAAAFLLGLPIIGLIGLLLA